MYHRILNSLAITTFFPGLITVSWLDNAVANESSGRGITVTIEAPKVQSTQLSNADEYFVIDFEDQSGVNSFDKTNGDTTYSYSSDLQVKAANEWGGANVSKFITQNQTESGSFLESFKINVTEDQKYFGFWWSAGDPYNEITFKNNDVTVASFRTEDLVDFINNSGIVNTEDYQGNPNSVYDSVETNHKNEPFSFVNVFFNDDSAYDEIVITSDQGGAAFESDNHTFSAVKQPIRGEVIPNNAPVANDDIATITINSSAVIDALANDTDPDGDVTTITSIDTVFGGDAVIENNKIVYTAGGVIGEYTLTYTVQDEYGETDSGTVTIDVVGYAD